ncbi:MAG: hypothetical protein NXI32_18205 [bacterium]|nr:hypothetical protein [bacterium]
MMRPDQQFPLRNAWDRTTQLEFVEFNLRRKTKDLDSGLSGFVTRSMNGYEEAEVFQPRTWRQGLAPGGRPCLYPHFYSVIVLVLNEMVLVIESMYCGPDYEHEHCPTDGARARVLIGFLLA